MLISSTFAWDPTYPYSVEEAQKAWKHCVASYEVNDYSSLVEDYTCKGCLLNDVYSTKAHEKDASQGYSTYEIGTKTFWMVFTGSENFGDWKDNFNFIREETFCGDVSRGFIDQYERIRDDMIKHYQQIVSQNTVSKIIVTGHSLGGASAQLMACYLRKFNKIIGDPKLVVISFSAPRVGYESWVSEFKKSVTMHWRHINYKDQVPYIPPRNDNTPRTILMESTHMNAGYKICGVSDAEDGIFEKCNSNPLTTFKFVRTIYGYITDASKYHSTYFGISTDRKSTINTIKTESTCWFSGFGVPNCEKDVTLTRLASCGWLNAGTKRICEYKWRNNGWSSWSICDNNCLENNRNGIERRFRWYTFGTDIRTQHETRNCSENCRMRLAPKASFEGFRNSTKSEDLLELCATEENHSTSTCKGFDLQ